MNTTITTMTCGAPSARRRAALVAAFLLAPLLCATPAAFAEKGARSRAEKAAGAATTGARPAADATRAADAAADKGAVTPTGTVNLNEASEDQLMLLPGVGPSKAAAIVAWRAKHGRFKKVDDLTRVKGFGRKTLQKLRPSLALSGATTYRGKKNPAGDGFFGTPPADDTP